MPRTTVEPEMGRIAVAERSAELVDAGVPHVRATVVRAEHPTSVHAGDSALVHADGTIEGFVGGTCAEASVQTHARAALEAGEPLLLRILPEGGDATAVGASDEGAITVANPCLSGGALEIFLEPLAPPARVLVVGDTPIAHALVDLSTPLGFDAATIDDATLVDADLAAVVVASHGRGEEQALTAALAAEVPYVALVAGRRRGGAVLASLDVPDDVRARVSMPAGLDIGARTAPEIALSILAELVESRRSRGHGEPVAVVEKSATDDGSAADHTPTAPGTAVDPVCGMTVLMTDDAITANVDGETAWFCCAGCRARWVATR
ncbi:MAG TPA: XdhC family protein [Euzebyales bacterium]